MLNQGQFQCHDLLGSLLIVVAHPDDETLAAGGHFRDWSPGVVHLTDGAPLNHPHRDSYAAVRRDELFRVYDLAGISRQTTLRFGVADQDVSQNMVPLIRRLADHLTVMCPLLVLTHPYEGGHPDHDSAALIVQAAVQLAGRKVIRGEFTSYHNAPPFQSVQLETGCFLPGPEPVFEVSLSPERLQFKQQLLACFESQQEMIGQFDVSRERFRIAPEYDFTLPPHPGLLFYDSQSWGIQSSEWRRLAAEALTLL